MIGLRIYSSCRNYSCSSRGRYMLNCWSKTSFDELPPWYSQHAIWIPPFSIDIGTEQKLHMYYTVWISCLLPWRWRALLSTPLFYLRWKLWFVFHRRYTYHGNSETCTISKIKMHNLLQPANCCFYGRWKKLRHRKTTEGFMNISRSIASCCFHTFIY